MDTSFLPRDDYEAVVIGSGFGGAVAACRLAQAGIDVAVIERGRRFPPGSFARDLGCLDSGWLWIDKHGLYDIRPFSDMLCVVAAGYGGGSLAYANVAIRPPPGVLLLVEVVRDDRYTPIDNPGAADVAGTEKRSGA